MWNTVSNVRVPAFLEGVNLEKKIQHAGFLGEHRTALAGLVAPHVDVPANTFDVQVADLEEIVVAEPADVLPPVPAVPLPPALPPEPLPPPVVAIDMSRMDAAIDRLRMLSERLAAEARTDVLELGLMIARKVVEGELQVNADRLIGVVKSAVARVGDSRRIVVHLAPDDAALLGAKGDGPTPPALERLGRGAAKIEVVADASLSRGDCVIEGDHLSVDATLDSKFSEIRRALLESAWEEGK